MIVSILCDIQLVNLLNVQTVYINLYTDEMFGSEVQFTSRS